MSVCMLVLIQLHRKVLGICLCIEATALFPLYQAWLLILQPAHTGTYTHLEKYTSIFWSSQSSIAASTIVHLHWYVCIHVYLNAKEGEKWETKKETANQLKDIWRSIECHAVSSLSSHVWTQHTCKNARWPYRSFVLLYDAKLHTALGMFSVAFQNEGKAESISGDRQSKVGYRYCWRLPRALLNWFFETVS